MKESGTVVKLEQWEGGIVAVYHHKVAFFFVTLAVAREVKIGDRIEVEIDERNIVTGAKINGKPIQLPERETFTI